MTDERAGQIAIALVNLLVDRRVIYLTNNLTHNACKLLVRGHDWGPSNLSVDAFRIEPPLSEKEIFEFEIHILRLRNPH